MVLRLTVEGPEKKVRAFLKDFSMLPQHKVLATSVPYEDDELAIGEVPPEHSSKNFIQGPAGW
jgi:hypothetical protein